MRFDASMMAHGDSGMNGFEFFTTSPVLYDSAARAIQRIEAAVGDSGLDLVNAADARECTSLLEGCGFELSFAPVVQCFGDPDPARACTSPGARGTTLAVKMQSEMRGDELDNRLIHELFHVITRDRAEHSVDGLFMQYTVGDEPITSGTLEAVCASFECTEFRVEGI
jgi:hypothetical protein